MVYGNYWILFYCNIILISQNCVTEEQLPKDASKSEVPSSIGEMCSIFTFPWFSKSTKTETETEKDVGSEISKDENKIPIPSPKVEEISKDGALKVEKAKLKQARFPRLKYSRLPKAWVEIPEVKLDIEKNKKPAI